MVSPSPGSHAGCDPRNVCAASLYAVAQEPRLHLVSDSARRTHHATTTETGQPLRQLPYRQVLTARKQVGSFATTLALI